MYTSVHRFISSVFVAALPLILSGCNKNNWLDVKTNQGLVVPATFKDFQALLDNTIYYPAGLAEIASDGHYMTEADWQARGDNERNAYIWGNLGDYNNVLDWTTSYQQVFVCNLALEGLRQMAPTGAGQETWNQLYGSALFLRSWSFFGLSQVYAGSYDGNTAINTPGIPLRLESDINIPSQRASLQQTYATIIDDLKTAVPLLSVSPLYKTRPCKPAAYALLSRVYLSQCNYEQAGLYADSCLQLYSNLLPYTTLTTTATYPIPLLNTEVIFHSILVDYASLRARALIEPSLYNSFEKNDIRRDAFFNIAANGNISFKGSYNNGSISFAGITTAELYLTRAEYYARNNQLDKCAADINTLLSNRYQKNSHTSVQFQSAGEALGKVLLERKKELQFRGLRWTDMRRLNKEPAYQVTVQRTVQSRQYTLAPESLEYIFKLPADIIAATGMPQNP